MARGFDSALDDCLAAIRQGESIEDCLARYPKHAETLRTQLLLASRLMATPRHEPRPGAQAAAWEQFRVRAEDRRLGRTPRFSLNLTMGWMKPLAITAGLVLAVLVAGGGTVYASQDALPDSPLYRVKLAAEDVQVWFTFDDSSKADLLLDQSNERTDEILEMLRRGKDISGNVLTALRERNAKAVRILEDEPGEQALVTLAREQSAEQEALLLVLWGDLADSAQDEYAEVVATLHNAQLRITNRPGSVTPDNVAAGVINIAGTAEQTDEGVWLLGGVEVTLDARALGDTNIQSGQAVTVIAARGADGRLLALNVRATDDEVPEQQYIVSGAVDEVSDDEVVIAGQRIAITNRTLLKLKLRRGQQVEIRVEDVDGQAVASSVEGSAGDSGDEALALLAYQGIIEEEISTEDVTNEWVIGGQEFLITPDTEIDARAGVLTRGARVRVEAVVEDGDVTAKRVVVLAADPEDTGIRVEGLFEKGDQNSWIVSGVEVVPPEDTDLPEVGSLVTLSAGKKGKRLVADQLLNSFAPGPNGFAILRGSIGAIGEDGTWRIGFAPVQTDDETVVGGEPQVGNRVFIWGSRDDEGLLRAIYVNVLDGTASAAEPAPEE